MLHTQRKASFAESLEKDGGEENEVEERGMLFFQGVLEMHAEG